MRFKARFIYINGKWQGFVHEWTFQVKDRTEFDSWEDLFNSLDATDYKPMEGFVVLIREDE